jgi:hypothetical protein
MGFIKRSDGGQIMRILDNEDREDAERRAGDYYAMHGTLEGFRDGSFCDICGRALVVDDKGLPCCPTCSTPDPEAN